MPEIAEVARCVHFLRHHLVGKQIAQVTAPDDANIFGKVGTSGPAFEKALQGRTVESAGRQGKYFWLTFDRPPHAVMHLGMTGWVHVKGDKTAYTNYYKKMKDGEADVWPPKYWKFKLVTDSDPKVEVAFTDPRRFGRIRLVDCPGDDIRSFTPLKENGPDPVEDLDIFTKDYLKSKMRSKHVPIKALLLDQAQISGVGNWVADELLYHAKVHPEQYCDEFKEKEMETIYDAIRYVCQTAVDKLGDSDAFPEDWLFNHRWGKGGKDVATALPNGEKLAFITVGGRTSCYAPARQKKSGHVAASAKEEPIDGDTATDHKLAMGKASGRKAKDLDEGDQEDTARGKKKRKPASPLKEGKAASTKMERGEEADVQLNHRDEHSGKRRSHRLRKQAS